jgi:hypothetical protein
MQSIRKQVTYYTSQVFFITCKLHVNVWLSNTRRLVRAAAQTNIQDQLASCLLYILYSHVCLVPRLPNEQMVGNK